MNRKPSAGRLFAVIGLLVLAACGGPVEREVGVLSEDSASLLRVAANARDAGDPGAAIPLYRRAAQLSPDSPTPWIALGETLNRMAAYDEATEAWRRALILDPESVTALVGHGTTLTGLNQPHLALAKFRTALELAPEADVPGLHNAIGVAHDMLGNAAAAQASYRSGIDLADNDLALLSNLGLSMALSGKYRDAIATLERTIAMPGATARHRQNLALAYGLAGQTEDAARLARVDLDEQFVLQNLSYYAILRDLRDHAAKVAAVGSLRRGAPINPARGN